MIKTSRFHRSLQNCHKQKLQQLDGSRNTNLLFSAVGALASPNNFLNPLLLEDFELFFCLTLLGLADSGCSVCLASSLGDELDFCTEDGKSASAGEGLGFRLLDVGGGDLVKNLKMEHCFAMLAAFSFYFCCALSPRLPPSTTYSNTRVPRGRQLAGKVEKEGGKNREMLWAWTTASSTDTRLHCNLEIT